MKTQKLLAIPNLLIVVLCAAGLPSFGQAAPAWDVRGYWSLWFEVEDGFYPYSIEITNEDPVSGEFSGTAGQSYGISGTVSGSTIQWNDPQIGGYGGQFNGELSTNGTMIGEGMSDNNGHGIWYGFWAEYAGPSSGIATNYSPAVLTLQPTSQIVSVGMPASFTATASGDPAVTFQWQFNGADITGATNSSYVIPAAFATNTGVYKLVVSNALGTNTSTPASLSLFGLQTFPGVILYGPPGGQYMIQETPVLGRGTNWVTVATIALSNLQPYVFVDYGAITNNAMFYRAVLLSQ